MHLFEGKGTNEEARDLHDIEHLLRAAPIQFSSPTNVAAQEIARALEQHHPMNMVVRNSEGHIVVLLACRDGEAHDLEILAFLIDPAIAAAYLRSHHGLWRRFIKAAEEHQYRSITFDAENEGLALLAKRHFGFRAIRNEQRGLQTVWTYRTTLDGATRPSSEKTTPSR